MKRRKYCSKKTRLVKIFFPGANFYFFLFLERSSASSLGMFSWSRATCWLHSEEFNPGHWRSRWFPGNLSHSQCFGWSSWSRWASGEKRSWCESQETRWTFITSVRYFQRFQKHFRISHIEGRWCECKWWSSRLGSSSSSNSRSNCNR